MSNSIEVSKKTFQLIFDNSNITRTVKKETQHTIFYFNKATEQLGVKIYNYVSSLEGNFYLLDINA